MDYFTSPAEMEPLLVGETRPAYLHLIGLVSEFVEASAQLERMLAPETAAAIANLVTGMNCYYSNLIEGQHTFPLDIERALKASPKDGDHQKLQTLAGAHVGADRWAKEHAIFKENISQYIFDVHREFCVLLPHEMLIIEDGTKVEPGVLRKREVSVGTHVAPKADSIPQFLERYGNVYGRQIDAVNKSGIHRLNAVLSVFAAHHRLVWIHPFLDGNGRVSRIVLDSMLRACGVNRFGLWSMSRGFAKSAKQYMASLSGADKPRHGDTDGRGYLSEKKLVEFCDYAVNAAKDQAFFMGRMLSLDQIKHRIDGYFTRVRFDLKPEAAAIYHFVFMRGLVDRGAAGSVSRMPERTARDVLASLIKEGFLVSDSPKGKLSVGFPLHAVGSLFPNLYPAGDVDLPVPTIKDDEVDDVN